MKDIEQKALALLNEVSEGFRDVASIYDIHTAKTLRSALCRAIEQHEAFKQEVSDAVEDAVALIENEEPYNASDLLSRFIIAKSDPLVEAVGDALEALSAMGKTYTGKELTHAVRAALAYRGLEIVEKKL